MAPLGDEDIGRLDVPMNDPLGVSSIQAVRNLDCQVENLISLKRLAEDALLQRLALQEFHGNELLPFVLVDLMDRANVRMIEGRGGFGLALEPVHGLTVFRYRFREKLQGDKAAQ